MVQQSTQPGSSLGSEGQSPDPAEFEAVEFKPEPILRPPFVGKGTSTPVSPLPRHSGVILAS